MATKSIAFAFGRFNPPTIGHEKLMDMTRGANRNYRIYASQTQDAKRNPLTHTKKVKYMKDMFPVHKRKISRDKLTTAIDVLVKLYKEKYTDVVMIAGSDRVAEFDNLLKKYNGVKAKHGFYKFKSIRVVSAGERDPDAEGLSGMSASKMRKAAQDNKYGTFKQGVPRKYNGKELFKAVQKAMGTRTLREYVEVEIDEGGLAPDSPSHGPGLELKKKVTFYDKKLKKKDTGPTPADQIIPKDKASRIESKLPSKIQKIVHKSKPKSKDIEDVMKDMTVGGYGHRMEYTQSDASKEFQARMSKRKKLIGRPKEPEKLSFFLKRARKAGYNVKKEEVELDEIIFNKRAYDSAAKWYGKFTKRGDKSAVALHKAAGMVRGVKDRDLQKHLMKAKLL